MSRSILYPVEIFFRKSALSALVVLACALLPGCLGHQKGSVVPGTQISTDMGATADSKAPVFEVRGNYFVEHLPEDGRGINRLIVECLRDRGLKAATGEPGALPEGTDIVVTYQDRWMWDMTMYMIRLNIQMKTANGDLLASGESYRLSGVRKPPEFMVNEILNEIYEEADPSLIVELPEKETKTIRRSRQGSNQYNDEYRF